MALTDTEVRRAKPGPTPYKVSDGGGLHLLVTPAGGRLWRYKYRVGGIEKLMALGAYPQVTLAKARERHASARSLLATGIDPMAERKAEQNKPELQFENVARKWHSVWAEQLVKGRKKSSRHVATVLTRMEANVFPLIGTVPINEIKSPQLVNVLKKMDGKFVLAQSIHGNVSLVFRYGIAHGLCEENPAAGFKTADILGGNVTKHFARIDLKDKGALPKLLRDVELYKGDPLTRLAMKLLMLTMTRTSELINATWDEFDLDAALWTIPEERMKARRPHFVPLSTQAGEILQLLKQLAGDSLFVFPGRDSAKKPMSNNTILLALKRMGYAGKQTGHGFRSIASTTLRENRFPRDHVEAQLAHQIEDDTEAAYNEAHYLDARRVMLQWYADHLENLQRGKILSINAA